MVRGHQPPKGTEPPSAEGHGVHDVLGELSGSIGLEHERLRRRAPFPRLHPVDDEVLRRQREACPPPRREALGRERSVAAVAIVVPAAGDREHAARAIEPD
jgi:hypothetical protein